MRERDREPGSVGNAARWRGLQPGRAEPVPTVAVRTLVRGYPCVRVV